MSKSTTSAFAGFPKEGMKFLRDLEKNNNREWFEEHKKEYQTHVQEPAVAFVETLGKRLQKISPEIQYDTRTNGSGSLMRIHRDTRFSKDKSPYKTYIGGMFWEGEGKKGNPGFGFMLQDGKLYVMAGKYEFSKEQLEAYREAVVDDALGKELDKAVAKVKKAGDYRIDRVGYKRVPRGYDAEHPRAGYLLHDAFYAHVDPLQGEILHKPELIDTVFTHCKNMAPAQQWLVKALDRVSA